MRPYHCRGGGGPAGQRVMEEVNLDHTIVGGGVGQRAAIIYIYIYIYKNKAGEKAG